MPALERLYHSGPIAQPVGQSLRSEFAPKSIRFPHATPRGGGPCWRCAPARTTPCLWGRAVAFRAGCGRLPLVLAGSRSEGRSPGPKDGDRK